VAVLILPWLLRAMLIAALPGAVEQRVPWLVLILSSAVAFGQYRANEGVFWHGLCVSAGVDHRGCQLL
jgi:hypothetical protein